VIHIVTSLLVELRDAIEVVYNKSRVKSLVVTLRNFREELAVTAEVAVDKQAVRVREQVQLRYLLFENNLVILGVNN